MSLTNEQKAHDLAIASLYIQYDIEKTKLLNIGKNEASAGNDISIDISFDPFISYQKLYSVALQAFNDSL